MLYLGPYVDRLVSKIKIMQVFIKITASSSNIGPNFSIVPNIGTSSPSNATLAQLTNGIFVTLSNTSATSITITSLGACSDSEVLLIGTTTTTTSSSSTTTTTTCIESCYKLTNLSSSPQTVSYLECSSGNTYTANLTPIGTSGSISYICSGIIINSTPSVLVETIFDFDSEYQNCPCAPGGIIITVPTECRSPINILFNTINSLLPGGINTDLYGPTLLSNLLATPGFSIDLCLSGIYDVCDIACSPVFIGSRAVQENLVQELSFGPGCYDPTLDNCCWISAQSSTLLTDYCQNGGISIIDTSTTTTTTCYSCTSICAPEFGAHITSNCDENCTGSSIFIGGPFTDGLALFQGSLTSTQYQDILDKQIVESGDYYFCRSLFKDIYNQIQFATGTLIYDYLNVILDSGVVITREGFGGCILKIQSAQSFLDSIEETCPTTTTTTSTTSTSTTTTTTCLCNAWDITIEQDDIDNSTFVEDGETIPGFVGINYLNCSGNIAESGFEIAGIYNEAICSCCTPSLFYFDGTKFVEATSTATITAIDCRSTTTTTTLPCNCVEITGVGDDCEPTSEGTYNDCDGNLQSYYLPVNASIIACMRLGTLNETSGKVEVEEGYGDRILADFGIDQFYATCQCIGTTTTTTSTSSTTTTTTCNCFVTSVLAINTDCDPCDQKLPATVKYTNCQGEEVVEQVPSGILTTLAQCVTSGSITPVTGTDLRETDEIEPCCNPEE